MGKIVTLGEVLLRLSVPSGKQLLDLETFNNHFGGAEANVGIGLSVLNHDVSMITCVPQNAIGHSAINTLRKFGINTTYVKFGGERLGLYFHEPSGNYQPASVIYDRKYSSFSSWNLNNLTFDSLFLEQTDVFHITGITAALSQNWRDQVLRVVKLFKEEGALISFDVNFRSSLWSVQQAKKFLYEILPLVDILSATQKDVKYLLNLIPISEDLSLEEAFVKINNRFPNIKILYGNNRVIHNSCHQEIQGYIWKDGKIDKSRNYEINDMKGRIGAGDALTVGVLHGILKKWEPKKIIEFGTANEVLKHSYVEDYGVFSEESINSLLQSTSELLR